MEEKRLESLENMVADLLKIVGHTNALLEETKQDIQNVRTELKQDIENVRSELKQDIQDVKTELRQEIEIVKIGLKQDMQDVRIELKSEIHAVRVELNQEIREVKQEVIKVGKYMEKMEMKAEQQQILVDNLTIKTLKNEAKNDYILEKLIS